jgi:hypothetical protein
MGIRKFNLRRRQVKKEKKLSPPPVQPIPQVTYTLLCLKHDFVDILFVLGQEAHSKQHSEVKERNVRGV